MTPRRGVANVMDILQQVGQNLAKIGRQSEHHLTSIIPIGSMYGFLTYNLGFFYVKCFKKIPVPWILWDRKDFT